jgi:hypothetical protein
VVQAGHEVIMTRDIELSCKCGNVHAVVTGVAPETVNRMVCYCSDCQAFAHQLHRADLLDDKGGTDVVQVAPAAVRFDRGQDQIRAVRLSDKGMFRWYASCCNTPLGNSPGTTPPFLGITRQAYATDALGGADAVFGPPRAAVWGQHAVGTPPPNSTKLNPLLIGRVLWSMLRWRVKGQHAPHPFFDSDTGKPKFPVEVLGTAERDALRPLCGPRSA